MFVDPSKSFRDLRLSQSTLATLEAIGYTNPSPIQAAVIPKAIEGVDVIGQARTGTGKTAAFSIPIIERFEPSDAPQALVLVPTRELALQVVEEMRKLVDSRPIKVAAIYGGHDMQKQIRALQLGIDIAVGTPGRVIDMINRGYLNLREIRTVVLDEADRMLDIGFRKDIERILSRTPSSRQTVLLSATMADEVAQIANKFMREPITLNLSQDELSVGSICQKYFTVDENRKLLLLLHLLVRDRPRQALVFCQTKHAVHSVAEKLKTRVRGVMEMSGDLPQTVRTRVMREFREGIIRIMIATDVVGRGIDVEGISHVVNYDVPEDTEAYVHRIGRTGRMGKDGTAYTFVTPEQGRLLSSIELAIGKQLERDDIEAFKTYTARAEMTAEQLERMRRPVRQRDQRDKRGGGGRSGGGRGGGRGSGGRGGPGGRGGSGGRGRR